MGKEVDQGLDDRRELSSPRLLDRGGDPGFMALKR
jgi:hypothetical protein